MSTEDCKYFDIRRNKIIWANRANTFGQITHIASTHRIYTFVAQASILSVILVILPHQALYLIGKNLNLPRLSFFTISYFNIILCDLHYE